jgi:hypothetical protein
MEEEEEDEEEDEAMPMPAKPTPPRVTERAMPYASYPMARAAAAEAEGFAETPIFARLPERASTAPKVSCWPAAAEDDDDEEEEAEEDEAEGMGPPAAASARPGGAIGCAEAAAKWAAAAFAAGLGVRGKSAWMRSSSVIAEAMAAAGDDATSAAEEDEEDREEDDAPGTPEGVL